MYEAPSTEPPCREHRCGGSKNPNQEMRGVCERPAMALAGRASVRVHHGMRAPPPRLAARCTPRARPGAAMPSRMGGWGGIRLARPAQRGRGAVLVQVRLSLVIP